jgi:lipid II:glycine glycyltransferase (peptidoglycan interpeptide bridge formation enzyme)
MPDSSYEVEVDRASPAEWSAMLDLFRDANLYQTWSYGAIRWGAKNLSHLVLKRGGEVLGMAQLRVIRPTTFKFGIAYLRWGPLCHRRGDRLELETVSRMTHALEEEYVSKRGLLLRVLPNAFVGSERADVFQGAFSGFTQEPHTYINTYRTFILDLAPPLEEMRRNLDKKWRNALSRSEKNRLEVVTGNGTDEYQMFCRMYDQMRKRKAFESSVSVEEFGKIQQDLPENHRMQILICRQEGVPVAGIVSSAMGDSSSYLLGATSDDGLTSKGAYLLQWTLIQWLKENGFRWYDLGGIDPQGNPGVYHFKSGLSGVDVSHMSSFVACNSIMTTAIITSGEAAYRAFRGCMSKLRRARVLAPSLS